ncbi:hypothetical protein V4S35_06015 [Enterococcus cecorum]
MSKEIVLTILINLSKVCGVLLLLAATFIAMAFSVSKVTGRIKNEQHEPIVLLESIAIQKIRKYSIEKRSVDGGASVIPAINTDGNLSMAIVPSTDSISIEKYDTFQYWVKGDDGIVSVKDFYEQYQISIHDDRVKIKEIADNQVEKLTIYGRKSNQRYSSFVFELQEKTIQSLQND